MSSTTTPQTFSDLYTDVLNSVRTNSSEAAAIVIAKRLVNKALHDVHLVQNWSWAERSAFILTHAPYTAGSISIASTARTTLEGTGTLWNTTVSGMGFTNARVGGKLAFGDNDVYVLSSITSDTAAAISSRYVGSIATATAYALAYGAYTYYEDEYALASDFFRLVDTRNFSTAMPIEVLGRQEFYRRYPRNSTTGKPVTCTILELGPSASVDPRPRVIFHPPPDEVYSLPYRYITSNLAVSAAGVAAANLSSDTDEPIIPLRYRHVLVFYAVAQWYRDRKDDERAGPANQEYVDLVKRMANDSEPQRDHPRFASPRALYHAGVAGPRRWPRRGGYSSGTAWDQLRD